jgi:peptide/nickel transport system substrate-binding protein
MHRTLTRPTAGGSNRGVGAAKAAFCDGTNAPGYLRWRLGLNSFEHAGRKIWQTMRRPVLKACATLLDGSRFALLLLTCVTACTRGTGAGGWGTPHELRIARWNDPSSLNPLFVGTQADSDLTQLYAEPLVGLNPQNALVPLVASRIPTMQNGDIARDGRTLTYHLRHDERFADGAQLTSADVAFTYRAIMDPRNPVPDIEPYRIIARLETPDPYTVVLYFRRPWSAAVSELFGQGILPAHAFNSTDIARSSWNERPFGSGPFHVVVWKRGDEIALEPNPYARRRPHLNRLVLKIASDRNTELLLLRTHAVDVMDYLTDLQAVQARSFPGITLVRTDENEFEYIALNPQRAPTNDIRVRRALIEAIDTRMIARKVYFGHWPLATTETPPVMWAHDPSVPPPSYDPKRAGRELDAAGWKLRNGRRFKGDVPLEVVAVYLSKNGPVNMVVQANLTSVGVQTVLRAYAPDDFGIPGGLYSRGRFNLWTNGWVGGSDPADSEIFTCDHRAPNGPNAGWCNARYERLYVEQSRLFNRPARRAIFKRMQRIVRDAAIFVPLVYQGSFSAINPALRGWKPNMNGEFYNSEDWDVAPR